MAHAKTVTKFRSCVVCGRLNSDRAHFKTRGSGAGWQDWEYTHLCRYHHMEQGHIGIHSFAEKYSSFQSELDAKGWVFINYFGTWKLRRKETNNA